MLNKAKRQYEEGEEDDDDDADGGSSNSNSMKKSFWSTRHGSGGITTMRSFIGMLLGLLTISGNLRMLLSFASSLAVRWDLE